MKRGIIGVTLALSLILVASLQPITFAPSSELPLAYAIHVEEENWIQVHQLANILLRAKMPVYWVSESFTLDGTTFLPGDVVVPITAVPIGEIGPSPSEVDSLTTYLADSLDVDVAPITSGVEFEVYVLKSPRMALYAGEGSGLCMPYVELYSTLGFTIEFVTDSDIRAGILLDEGYDILVIPGSWSDGVLKALGEEGGEKVEEFVKKGGGYISSCGGSWVAGLRAEGWDPSPNVELVNAKLWNVIEGVGIFKKRYPGIGTIIFKNVNPTHPVMWGMPETFEMVWWQGSIFDIVSGVLPDSYDVEALAVHHDLNTGKFTAAEYYLDIWKQWEEGFEDTAAYEAQILEKPPVVAAWFGTGKIALFGPHPEYNTMLSVNGFIYIPARMLANAAFWEVAEGPYTFTTHIAVSAEASDSTPAISVLPITASSASTSLKMKLGEVLTIKETILDKVGEVSVKYIKNQTPSWLVTGRSHFGYTPNERFEYHLGELGLKYPTLLYELETECYDTDQIITSLADMYTQLTTLEGKLTELSSDVDGLMSEVQNTRARLIYALTLINEGITIVPGPTVIGKSGGTEGVLWCVNEAVYLLESIIDNYDVEEPTASPLENIEDTTRNIVHALNILRGRTEYARVELLYANYLHTLAEAEYDNEIIGASLLQGLKENSIFFATPVASIIVGLMYAILKKKTI